MKKLTVTDTLQRRLSRLSNPPAELLYKGDDPHILLQCPVVAIVGTRKPTPYGKTVTKQLAEELARAGVVVISGNAMGVDVLAQKAALDAGGKVIAVLPSGLDKPYPAANKAIVEKILENGGALISEYPAGHSPTRYDFLHRNRLIAALADMVVIPEAAKKSGSLNTAKHAKEAGVPIGVVPGNITSHMSSGTNALLSQGVHAIRNAEDALAILGIDTTKQTSLDLVGDNETQTAILNIIKNGVVDPSDIQSTLQLSAVDYHMAITMLEVNKRILITDSGTIQLK